MNDSDYDLVDDIFTNHPDLIHSLDDDCDYPLLKAIRLWDHKLVGIAMKHGSNPQSNHICNHDDKLKNAFIVVAEVFLERIKKNRNQSKEFAKLDAIYMKILKEMTDSSPFPKGDEK